MFQDIIKHCFIVSSFFVIKLADIFYVDGATYFLHVPSGTLEIGDINHKELWNVPYTFHLYLIKIFVCLCIEVKKILLSQNLNQSLTNDTALFHNWFKFFVLDLWIVFIQLCFRLVHFWNRALPCIYPMLNQIDIYFLCVQTMSTWVYVS